jgi:hypothetical protein
MPRTQADNLTVVVRAAVAFLAKPEPELPLPLLLELLEMSPTTSEPALAISGFGAMEM